MIDLAAIQRLRELASSQPMSIAYETMLRSAAPDLLALAEEALAARQTDDALLELTREGPALAAIKQMDIYQRALKFYRAIRERNGKGI